MLNQKTNEHRESNDSSNFFTSHSLVTKSGGFSHQLKESKNCSDSVDDQKSPNEDQNN